jgi:microcystin-dependent protein
MTSYVRAPYTLNAHQKPTVGDTKMGFTNLDHMGWLKCDGRTVNVADFRLLFDVIGYTFGGSGATFTLPDFTGRVAGMAGKPFPTIDASPTTYTKGQKDGEQQHRLNIDEMPSHTHGSNNVTGNTNGNGLTTLNGQHYHTGTTDSNGTHNHGGSTGAGGTSGSETVSENALGRNVTDYEGSHTHSISADGNHTHTFTTSTEPNHQHQIFNTGGSNWHNNMQPTLFFGNMFVYCGRPNYGGESVNRVTIDGANFMNFPYFTPNNQVL